jgi:hypothetical protein
MVNQEEIPWCLSCDESHHEWSCPRNSVTGDGEGPSGFEILNFVEDRDFICTLQQKSHTVTDEQMRQIKKMSIDVARIARMNMLNFMDENSKNELR